MSVLRNRTTRPGLDVRFTKIDLGDTLMFTKSSKTLVYAIGFFVLFLAMIFLVKNVDVAAIGPEGTSIGLSHINKGFNDFTGVNYNIYKNTEIIGLFSFVCCGFFGINGIIQLIKRKNVFKVDRDLIALGVLYFLILGIYVFFEKVIINYRPCIMPGETELEASFPSSHTIMSIVVWGSGFLTFPKYIKKQLPLKIAKVVSMTMLILIVIERTACGCHWLSDIVAGMFLSACLVELYVYFRE